MTESLALSPHPASVPQGRRFVGGWLTDWGLGDLVDTAALLTSELLTNAVLHARTPLLLTVVRTASGAEISVRDGSRMVPRQRRHAQDATTGRGIDLLERLATSWEVTVDDAGKIVRFTLEGGRDPWAQFADRNWWDSDL